MLAKTEYPATLDGLIAWLETKPPEEAYNWYDSGCCAAAQFRAVSGRLLLSDCDALSAPFPGENLLARRDNYVAVAYGPVGNPCSAPVHQWTFGKMLARARQLRDTGRIPYYQDGAE